MNSFCSRIKRFTKIENIEINNSSVCIKYKGMYKKKRKKQGYFSRCVN